MNSVDWVGVIIAIGFVLWLLDVHEWIAAKTKRLILENERIQLELDERRKNDGVR